MKTYYVKNFSESGIQKLLSVFEQTLADMPMQWTGTVSVGPQKVLVDCRIKNIADKISDYFVDSVLGEILDNVPKLVVFNGNPVDYFVIPNDCECEQVFRGKDIYGVPDIVVTPLFLCVRYKNILYFMAKSADFDTDVTLVLGEHHILMRQLKYLLDSSNTQIIHGAVVGMRDFGVLISGLSGAGKSTLAACCIDMGLDFVGDDRVAITMVDGVPVANPIYRTISTDVNMKNSLGRVVSKNISRKKDIILLNRDFEFRHNLPIKAIVEPVRSKCNKGIVLTKKKGIMSRIVMDYSNMGCVVNSANPVQDWIMLSQMFQNVDFFQLYLNGRADENASQIFNLITKKENKCM